MSDVRKKAVDAKLRNMLLKAEPGKEYSTREIAGQVGLTHQRISQIEAGALRKLRNGLPPKLMSDLIAELRKGD